MLKTANLSYKFDDKYIFSGLDLEFTHQNIFKLIGDNGTGKSTFLKILCGIYRNYEGEISFDEDKTIYYSGHNPALKNNLSVLENIELDIRLTTHNTEEIDLILNKLSMTEFSETHVENLSEGQKRKVNILSFIISKADLYLLDEPFNNLDARTSEILLKAFTEKINSGSKIIFSSHDRTEDDFSIIDMNSYCS